MTIHTVEFVRDVVRQDRHVAHIQVEGIGDAQAKAVEMSRNCPDRITSGPDRNGTWRVSEVTPGMIAEIIRLDAYRETPVSLPADMWRKLLSMIDTGQPQDREAVAVVAAVKAHVAALDETRPQRGAGGTGKGAA